MQYLSLNGDLTRADALANLLARGVSDGSASELCIEAGAVERIDVVSGTATRMRVARHLREHTDGSVTIFPPKRSPNHERFADLLGPLPDDVSVVSRSTEIQPNYVLLPATPV